MLKLGALAQCTGSRPVPTSLVTKSSCASKGLVLRPVAPVPSASSSPCSIAARMTVVSAGSRGGAAGSSNRGESPQVEGYVEVKVDSVRVSLGASVVVLRLVGPEPKLLPVHIGEAESAALLKELNKTKSIRPFTHDLAKNLLGAANYKVTKIRITELVSSAYLSRVHIARIGHNNTHESEIDVDARPSDAINLAMRFGAPMYVTKEIAEMATVHHVESHPASTPSETSSSTPTTSAATSQCSQSETKAEIARSVREAVSTFEDPTVMLQLQKSMAISQQRFEDASKIQKRIYHEMTHSQVLRLVVAMEAALADDRHAEAAHLRDEFQRLVRVTEERKNKVVV